MKLSIFFFLTNLFFADIFCDPDSSEDDEYDFYGGMYQNKFDVMEQTDKLFESTFGSQISDLTGGKGDTNSFSDGLMETFGKMLDTIEDGDEDCTYKCDNGNKPVKRGGYEPVSNGCGATLGLLKVKLDTSGYDGIDKCCSKHDVCYGTCNKVREKCDDTFRDCMTKYCETDAKVKQGLNGRSTKICKYSAEMIHMGVEAFGCGNYIEWQREGCECKKQSRSDL